MIAVYKYAVPFEETFVLELPIGAKLLHFDNQHEKPTLWAQVITDASLRARHFRLVGTGHDLAMEWAGVHDLVHVGSAQFYKGDLVFHLFEVVYAEAL